MKWLAWLTACASGTPSAPPEAAPSAEAEPSEEVDPFAAPRARMVQKDLTEIEDARVLSAMGAVPRHRFVPASRQEDAYGDFPLPIGFGQTISQPFVVARMTEALDLQPGETVLEVGTGSGYQAAVLAELDVKVFSIEIVEEVAALGAGNLKAAGYEDRVALRVGDGYRGWPEEAPFQAIIVTAAPDHVPQPLLEQLAVGGVMVLPVGRDLQELIRLERKGPDEVVRERLELVRFVPMTGEAQSGKKAPPRP